MDKRFLVEQPTERLKASASREARAGATAEEKKEDGRVALENGGHPSNAHLLGGFSDHPPDL